MKTMFLLFLVMKVLFLCLSPKICSFASAQSKGTARMISQFSGYGFPCNGLGGDYMMAAGGGSWYKNGTGCGQVVMVTCDTEYASCRSSYPVVFKLTHYCVKGYCEDYNDNLILPEFSYSYLADPEGPAAIMITYELYTQDNYTQLYTLKQGEIRNLSAKPLVSANNVFRLETYVLVGGHMAISLGYDNRHPVWIANRYRPIYGYTDAFLALSTNGKFSLQDSTGEVIQMFYAAKIEGNMTVTLLDSGNLVLREMNSDGSVGKTLWQSFEYPTNTLLPGMKLGINHKTGQNSTLTSWFSDKRPENGAFSLEWDPKGRALVFRHRGVSYWTSGILMDSRQFEFLQLNDSSLYFTNVSNEDEEYFAFTLGDDKMKHIDISGWTLTLERTGGISFGDKPPILQEDFCSGYDELDGCQLREQPKCRPLPPTFENRSGIFLGPGNVKANRLLDNFYSTSAADCKESCWGFCDCLAYLYQWDQSYCYLWRGRNLSFVDDIASPALHVLSEERPPPIQYDHGKKLIWILIPLILFMLLLLIGIFSYLQRRKRQQRKNRELVELMTLDGYTEVIALDNHGKKGQDIKIFSYSCIEAATNGFSSENKLGEGGFGPVYKGQLPNGQNVAVKKLSKKSTQGLLEFKTELILIAKLQHDNLVRLFGYCIHGNEKMLIYEYMANKSLDFFLFDETKKQQLPWEKRFRIVEGIAQGLLYLHKFSRLKIVHRDLKAGNILLDENMNPHISDFGTARIFKPNISETDTIHISGTRGYMAPEYREKGTFSIKSDVFSFGILVLEILSGCKANSFYDAQRPMNLVTYAWELWNGGAAIDFIDRTLVGSCTVPYEMIKCIHVGLLCVQLHANHRPTMSEVIFMFISFASP